MAARTGHGRRSRGWNVRSISELTGAHRRRTPGLAARVIASPCSSRPAARPSTRAPASSLPRPASRRPRSRARDPSSRWPTRPTATLRATRRRPPDAAHAAYTGQIRRISATDAETVVFELCGPDVAFRLEGRGAGVGDQRHRLARVAHRSGDERRRRRSSARSTAPGRTGSRLEPGTEVSLARNDGYWGDRAVNERRDRPLDDDAGQRLAELQDATVDGIDDVVPARVEAVDRRRRASRLAPRQGSTSSTSASQHVRPVRQRAGPPGDRDRASTAGASSTPLPARHRGRHPLHAVRDPVRLRGRPVVRARPDPARKELLAAAGFPDGFDTTIQLPRRSPRRTCRPDRRRRPSSRPSCSTNLGIGRSSWPCRTDDLPRRRRRRASSTASTCSGQARPTRTPARSSIRTSGRAPRPSSASRFDDIGKALRGRATTSARTARSGLRQGATTRSASHVPMVPLAHVGSAAAFRADVDGAATSPLRSSGSPPMTPGDRRQFVWLSTAEPAGLYCADETDEVATARLCPADESLYGYDPTERGDHAGARRGVRSERGPDGLDLHAADAACGSTTGRASTPTTSCSRSRSSGTPSIRSTSDGRATSTTSLDWFGGFLNPPVGAALIRRISGR